MLKFFSGSARRFASGVVLSVVFLGALPPLALAASDVHMLPPFDFNGNVCAGANGGVLQWDGTHDLRCIPGFMGDKDGHVGIGTTSPATTLHLNSATGGTIRMQYTGNSGYAEISTNATNDLLLTPHNGSVGIGTTTPGAKLEVRGNSWFGAGSGGGALVILTPSSTNQLGIKGLSGSSTTASTIQFGDNESGASRQWAIINGWNGASPGFGSLFFNQSSVVNGDAANGVNVLTLQNGGNVGIGTTTPGQALDVVGNQVIHASATTGDKLVFNPLADG